MVRDILRLDLVIFSVSKQLNRVEKIPTCVAMNSADRGFHCSRDFVVIFVLLSDSK